MTSPWARLSNKAKCITVMWPIVVIGWAAALVTGLMLHAPVIHDVRAVRDAPAAVVSKMTAAQVAVAWGTPDQSVDGGQVNSSLAGTTCDIWQSRRAILCYSA